MNATAILADLLLRADMNMASAGIVTADEASTWPPGTLADLIAVGVLTQSQPETVVTCDACFNDHAEPIQFVDSSVTGPPRAYIVCPEAGRVSIDSARLVRWRIDVRRLNAAITRAGVTRPSGRSPKRRQVMQAQRIESTKGETENLTTQLGYEQRSSATIECELLDLDPSQGYASFRRGDVVFTLSETQAEVVRILHAAYRRGTPDVTTTSIKAALRERFQREPHSMRDIFRTVDNHDLLITSRRRGTYRLNAQPPGSA